MRIKLYKSGKILIAVATAIATIVTVPALASADAQGLDEGLEKAMARTYAEVMAKDKARAEASANIKSGYLQDDTDNQWYWFENGQKYTGFHYYMGAYYYFKNGVRQTNQWETAWGATYYVGDDGRTVSGIQVIDGQAYDFGTKGAFYLKGMASGYLYSPSYSTANGGYNWFEFGQPYTGFRYYMGTYYWFVNGVRQNAGWREAWGYTYYTDANGRAVQGTQTIDGKQYNFGNDGTYYLR